MGKKYVTFSFDDGVLQDVRLVQLFDKYNIKCTFNINSGHLGRSDKINVNGIIVDHSHVTADSVAELYKNHEIAVHTVNHPALDRCDDERIIYEVEQDRISLEALVNYPIVGMAYPGGPFYNDHVIDVILKNTPIVYARDIQNTFAFNMPDNFMKWHPTCFYKDLISSDIIERFLQAEPKEDMLLYVWGHAYDIDINEDWDNFEEILKTLSNSRDLIFVKNKELLNI